MKLLSGLKILRKNRSALLWPAFVFICLLLPSVESPAQPEKKILLNTMESVPYQGKKLRGQGFLVEISREAFRRAGYKLEVKFVPWKRAIFEARNGKVDGVLGAWYNKKRTKAFAYTDYIGKSTLIFLKRREQKINYRTLKDLRGYRIGVVRGYTYTDKFDRASYLIKDSVPSTELNLRKLLRKRIDLTPDVKEVVFYTLRAKLPEFRGSIDSVGKPLKVHLIYNIISRKNPNYKSITRDFNKGLQSMKRDGTYTQITSNHGISP